MQQPQGFIDPHQPYSVCKLVKSLYRLKQAPRAWFDCFASHLLTLGFQASLADSSLFVRRTSDSLTYLLLYVDDITLTETHASYIDCLISQLKLRFDMTDLGPLRFFLGLEIAYSSHGISVHQSKYTKDVLTRFGMLSAKPCSTPIALSSAHTSSLCSDADAKNYRSLVGALHYLTFSRPNIAFAVSKLSQHLHSPTDEHLVAAKRVLRYLRGSVGLGLIFQKGCCLDHSLRLTAYSDSDWAGDSNDRRSTIGFVIFLGSSPIS
ncbi:uncharacterized protein LOC111019517 [Momordica charantia]|uniref:Uncharacterized protein LOC111019517 n=1 Tax=Momordica charantia TaxID=3673 RepID=A0A6J1DDJ2_MOMCH|nr:uncharacterized protein LOC111019517 [Momordica charantia]